jgi:hypothetical protein
MAEKKKTPPARLPEVEQTGYVQWRPQKRDKNHNPNSKRKLPFHDPSFATKFKLAEPNDADLVKVLAEMGPKFELSDEKRRELLEAIIALPMTVTPVLQHENDRPPRSELDERLAAIESAADRLYRLFEIGKDVEQAIEHDVLSSEVNPILFDLLAAETPQSRNLAEADEVTSQPDREMITAAVTAVAYLAIFAKRARKRLQQNSTRQSPDDVHAILFAVLYRESFGSEPVKSDKSAWVKFLRWGRTLSSLPHLSPDRLRRQATSKKPAT